MARIILNNNRTPAAAVTAAAVAARVREVQNEVQGRFARTEPREDRFAPSRRVASEKKPAGYAVADEIPGTLRKSDHEHSSFRRGSGRAISIRESSRRKFRSGPPPSPPPPLFRAVRQLCARRGFQRGDCRAKFASPAKARRARDQPRNEEEERRREREREKWKGQEIR